MKSFNLPGETQRERLRELKKEMPKVGLAVLQIKTSMTEYRILDEEEVTELFTIDRAPMDPILDWLRDRLS